MYHVSNITFPNKDTCMKRLKQMTLGDETIEYGKPFQIAKACEKKKHRKSKSVEG